ncbi:hypothetical protein HYALB_00001213 [Hymenoscyphus albidus]|uniref:Tubby C-terminal-like domain-containing protein n=1 Tax=Hymenoscyphus albidus TaxID=595503 RepID=A0A9N9LH59_9HELO|nr:hypothetical protein HYALB_00001213 [Hymenoscyphus albidus]
MASPIDSSNSWKISEGRVPERSPTSRKLKPHYNDVQHESYSMLEVVPLPDDKIALQDSSNYSTLEAIIPDAHKIANHDFAQHQNYSTLEIPNGLVPTHYPFSIRSRSNSLRSPSIRSPSIRSASSSILDSPLPPLPPMPAYDYDHQNQYLSVSRSPSRQTLSSKQSIRSHISRMATQSRIKECGVWFDRQFYAGDTGMEIWMSRNSTIFRDMRWEVICGTRRVLGIKGNPHSWGQKREFTDTRGNVLFRTKKQGSQRRIAESNRGQTVFAFTRDPDTLNPTWTVEFTNARDKRTVCFGVPIGRISRPEGGTVKEKNSYIVKVSPGFDYTIMCALTVAVDDFRQGGGGL